jgi:7-carboxy-7-deazaguanine synthase
VGLRGLRRPGPGRAGAAHAATATARWHRDGVRDRRRTPGPRVVGGPAPAWLPERGWRTQIETNGTLAPRRLGGSDCWPDDFNVSPKLATGINQGADPASKRIRPKAIEELLATGRAVWKFVAADVDDLDEIDCWIERFGLPIDNVWVMPEGTSTAGLTAHTQQLAEAVLARGLNLTTRLHILVWGAERGR